MRIVLLSLCICLGCGGRIDGGTNVVNGGSGGGNPGSGSGSGSSAVCDGQLVSAKSPRKLATDGSFVYWTTWGDAGSVWRVGVDGGTPQKLADDTVQTTDIVVDDQRVYWIGYGAHVASTWKGGGPVKIHTSGSVEHVAVLERILYVSRTDRITRIESDVETTIVKGDGIDPLAVSDRVWFIERGKGNLRWAPKSGGDATTVASAPELVSVYDLAADSTGVFGVTTNTGVVWHADDKGLTPRKSGFECPANVAFSIDKLYFGNASIACKDDLDLSQREIVRLENTYTQVAGHAMLSGISGITADARSVYWSGGDAIYCAPR